MGKKKVDSATPVSSARDMQGFETAVVKFRRKPAKMGADYIFWIPRTYIRNGLVDPSVEYEVYLKRIISGPAPSSPQPAAPQDAAPDDSQPDSS